MRSHRRAALALCVLAWATPAIAAVPPWPDRFSAPNVRDEQAKIWLKGISKLEASVPTLSPEQRAWLKTEYDDEIQRNGGKYTKRALKASESIEYQVAVARPQLEQLKALLTTLTTLSPPYDFPKEAELWTGVAVRFMDQNLWQAVTHLVRHGVVDKSIDGVDELYFENHVFWAQVILQRGVIPMLELTSAPSPGSFKVPPRQPVAPR
jgi:hypothetical protein